MTSRAFSANTLSHQSKVSRVKSAQDCTWPSRGGKRVKGGPTDVYIEAMWSRSTANWKESHIQSKVNHLRSVFKDIITFRFTDSSSSLFLTFRPFPPLCLRQILINDYNANIHCPDQCLTVQELQEDCLYSNFIYV